MDVAIIGLGRIGLPLALAFADAGSRVIGVDIDPGRLAGIRAGTMPFEEPGAQEVLERVLPTGRLAVSSTTADAAAAEHVVITLGTPSYAHIEIDIRDIRRVIDELLPVFRPGMSLILRSTVAPGTTDFVAGYIEQRRGLRPGIDIYVAHVPERIAAGRFVAEIGTLPCIVGAADENSGQRVGRLFARLGAPIIQTTPIQAELAKIWTNIIRYTKFALPNLLMMDCEKFGANVFQVVDLINRDYPRGGIAFPGLTAGTCLRKDFAFSEERLTGPGMLLAVSRVNESIPLFLVEGVKRRIGPLRGQKVAVLGLTFKRDSDDERDSLAHKLIRFLERELADVAVHDRHVRGGTLTFEDVVADAKAVIVATNHSEFSEPAAFATLRARAQPDCLLVDPWNSFGTAQVFTFLHEVDLLALTSELAAGRVAVDR